MVDLGHCRALNWLIFSRKVMKYMKENVYKVTYTCHLTYNEHLNEKYQKIGPKNERSLILNSRLYSEMDIGVDVSFSAQRWHSLIEAVMQTHFEPNMIAFSLIRLQNLKI